jgi:hypothetical protein
MGDGTTKDTKITKGRQDSFFVFFVLFVVVKKNEGRLA